MKEYIVSLSEANLLLQQQICSKDELLRRLSAQAAKLPTLEKIGLSSREIYLALLQREEELATTIGNGIIFPHARLPMLHGEPVVIIATLAGELHLKTPDDIPINIACMILIPDDNPMQGLKILSALTRNLKDQEFRAVLTNAKSFSDVLPMFGNLDVSRIESLMAADIALPPRCFATTDIPLKEATKLMVHFHTNAIPVLDNNRLAGQISSRR